MPLADRYDSFLFDLDGVLYRGDQPVEGGGEVVRRLREAGKGMAFVTNNSSRTTEQVGEKLHSMGVEARPDEIVSSAEATAEVLGRDGHRRAFVVGEAGIRVALRARGIEVLDGSPGEADVVVVGWDRSADYGKLRTAALLVQRGARLVATNADASYPAPDGLWPGAGALLAAVTTTTGAVADVIGKPYPPLLELARERAGGGRSLSVGDRLDTDVAGAVRLGWDSLLVLTGVSRPADLLRSDELPTFTGRDTTALFADASTIRDAGPGDETASRSLLRAAGLRDDVRPDPAHETATLVATDLDTGRLAGTVTLERAAAVAHMRALAVEEDRRGAALGALLTAHAVRLARAGGSREVFIATETTEAFFGGLGFAGVGGLDSLPAAFRQHMGFCAETAVVMRFVL